MDTMSLFEIVTVGVPEVTMSLILGLIICKGNVFKEYKGKWIELAIRMAVSNIFILSITWIERQYVSSTVFVSIISMILYILSLKLFFKLNLRQSIVATILMQFTLMILEVLLFSTVNVLIALFNIQYNIFSNRFLSSLPLRFVHLLLITILYNLNLNFANNTMFTEKWSILSLSRKINMIILMIFVGFSVIFNNNYLDILIKSQLYKIDISGINNNLLLYFLETVLYISLVLILFNRTIAYEKYKLILNKTSEEFIEEIVNKSSSQEKCNYAQIIVKGLSITSFNKLENFFQEIKNIYPLFTINLDDSLSQIKYDFTQLMYFLGCIMNFEQIKKNQCDIKIYLQNNNIVSKLIINTHELEANRIMKVVQNNFLYRQAEKDLRLETDSKIDIKHQGNTLEFDIKTKYKGGERDEKVK